MSRASQLASTCQFVRPARARLNGHPSASADLCGSPARFIWHGFDPKHLGKTKAEQKKYIRVSLPVCVDCALELLHEWGWHIKDGKARLERMDVEKFRAHCGECGTTMWAAWDKGEGGEPVPQGFPSLKPDFAYCPRCGAKAVYMIDQLQDVWEVMSQDLAETGIPFPMPILQYLYSEWPNAPRRFWRFYDYVKYQQEVFDRTGDFEVAK